MKVQCFLLQVTLTMLLLVASMVGCQSINPGEASLALLYTSTPQAIATISSRGPTSTLVILTPTLLSTLTTTATPSPEATKTPWPTWTPKPTPLPTLPPEQARAFAWELYQTNAGCQLPCWWGFTPGQTYWKTAEHFLAAFASQIAVVGSVADPSYTVYVNIPVPEEIFPVPLEQAYMVEGGLITQIQAQTKNVPAYSLPSFLTTYGEPSEVWMRTYSKSREGDLPFDVVLAYLNNGIMVRYDISAEETSYEIRGCPQEATSATFSLWPPEQHLSFAEALDKMTFYPIEQPLLRLEEATSMNEETFYQTFVDLDNITCLETPAELWSSP